MIKKHTIAALYIWLLPVTSVPLLYFVKNEAGQTGFLIASVVHLLIITAALWILYLSGKRIHKPTDHNSIFLTGALLIFGAAITWMAATTFRGTALNEIATHNFEHLWTSGGFLLGSLVSFAGITLLTIKLWQKENQLLLSLGFVASLVGFIAWIIHLSFRLTVMTWAAKETVKTGGPVSYYEMWTEWAGLLYAVYMLLTYISLSAYGGAILKTDPIAPDSCWDGWLPRWLGRTNLVFGLAAAVLFASGIAFFGMPLTVQLMPWLIGISLLRVKRGKE